MSFFQDEKFIVPLLATLGASLAVIGMQIVAGHIKGKKQKIYTATYMLDVTQRILFSSLIVKKHTIEPHIEATERIIEGDEELLKKTFLSDEFDILKAQAITFSHLPTEYKLLIGYDNIEIIQAFQTLLYLYETDDNRSHLNEFVKQNLKSTHFFLTREKEKQDDILYTYHDLMTTLNHECNRVILFAAETMLPILNKYISNKQFALFSTSNAKKIINKTQSIIVEYKDVIPESGYMGKVKHGGIQGEL